MGKVILTVVGLAIVLLGCTMSLREIVGPTLIGPSSVVKITSELPEIHTRVEFVISEKDQERYPLMAKAFTDALTEWSKHLPIEIAVYATPNGQIDRQRVISVDFGKIDGKYDPEDKSGSTLGRWQAGYLRRLQLDAEDLEGKEKLAYVVAMHEIGHVFGLVHVVERGSEKAETGDMMLKPEDNPQSYLMYPSVGDKVGILSDLEIVKARQYVEHHLGLLDGATRHDCDCHIDS